MKIKVEQKHIDEAFNIFTQKGIFNPRDNNGKYDNVSCRQNCPIALALKDMGFKYVSVDSFAAHFSNNSVNRTRVELPIDAIKFVDKFDYDGKVEPFEFEVDE